MSEPDVLNVKMTFRLVSDEVARRLKENPTDPQNIANAIDVIQKQAELIEKQALTIKNQNEALERGVFPAGWNRR